MAIPFRIVMDGQRVLPHQPSAGHRGWGTARHDAPFFLSHLDMYTISTAAQPISHVSPRAAHNRCCRSCQTGAVCMHAAPHPPTCCPPRRCDGRHHRRFLYRRRPLHLGGTPCRRACFAALASAGACWRPPDCLPCCSSPAGSTPTGSSGSCAAAHGDGQ